MQHDKEKKNYNSRRKNHVAVGNFTCRANTHLQKKKKKNYSTNTIVLARSQLV